MKHYAVILASGTGERTGLNIPKQFVVINNKTVLEHSIDKFENHKDIDGIVLVINPLFLDMAKDILSKNNYKKIVSTLAGGKTRQESSYIGICEVKDINSNVLIHDAVRPFVTSKIISDCIGALKKYKAVNVATESSDTIIEVDENNFIKAVPKRKTLRRCQTPQCFNLALIKKAHEMAIKDNAPDITDDCSLILKYNLSDIYIVDGDDCNIKITYPIDIEIAKLIEKKESK